MDILRLTAGNRIGFCGTAVLDSTDNYSVETVKTHFFRKYKNCERVFGAGEDICAKAFSNGPSSLIIGGPPACGKTTVLRDLCRDSWR